MGWNIEKRTLSLSFERCRMVCNRINLRSDWWLHYSSSQRCACSHARVFILNWM